MPWRSSPPTARSEGGPLREHQAPESPSSEGEGAEAGATGASDSSGSRVPPGPGPHEVPTAALRPALELAWAVARRGLGEEPPVDVPRLLRPLLSFSRLPARALETVRRALEDDGEFRARVAGEVDQSELDRPSWLFLARPPGWEDEVGRAGRAARLAAEAALEDQEERTARRQLRGAQEAARRAEDATREAQQALAAVRARTTRMAEELAAERGARLRAEEELGALRKAMADLGESRNQVERRLTELEARLAREESGAKAQDGVAAPVVPEAVGATGPAWPPAAEVTAATRSAAEAASELSSMLTRIAAVLEAGAGELGPSTPSPPSSTPTGPPPARPAPGVAPRPDPGPGSRRPTRSVPGRRPIPLPPGLLEEAPESAEHLVRTNGVVLVVDGYNVSHACWPVLAIAEQRRRLVDALSELAARTGADVEVIFDGGEHDQPAPPGATRQLVKTRFSPPGTEADDVILEMVERYPAHRPVVVATSDRRVRDGVRQRGANVISAGQLLKVLRRDRGW